MTRRDRFTDTGPPVEILRLPVESDEVAARWPSRLLNLAAADINLDRVQAEWERHLDRLLAGWVDVTTRQRREITEQVQAAVDSTDLAKLAKMSVSTKQAETNLLAAMDDMAVIAAQHVVDEAAAQDVNIEPKTGDRRQRSSMATAVALLLAEGLTNSAGREALRQYYDGAPGATVASAVDEHLAGLSDSFLATNLGWALTATQNDARVATMLAAPEAAIYASEQMDANTCRNCAAVNGKFLGLSTQPDQIALTYPNGGYIHCLGRQRCRGTPVAIWRPEQTGEEEMP